MLPRMRWLASSEVGTRYSDELDNLRQRTEDETPLTPIYRMETIENTALHHRIRPFTLGWSP